MYLTTGLFLLLAFIKTIQTDPVDTSVARYVYDSATLKSIRSKVIQTQYDYTLAKQLSHTMRRKRGRKGGVKARSRRRKNRPVLPVLIMGNARSLNNKIDELEASCKYLHEYRDASILCFSESWFKSSTPDSAVQLNNFHLVRGDRDPSVCAKTRGGGVCAYVNKNYCHPSNVHVIKKQCLYEIEILSLSLRPFYVPREFPKIILNVIYIPDKANSSHATQELSDLLNEQSTSSPDAVIITTGDFNHCTLDPTLPFYQHVNCPTRNDTTLDLCYTNIKNCYKTKILPPLGSSDHNIVMLLPDYITKFKATNSVEKSINVLDKCGNERLVDCFDCTDWQVFIDSCTNISELNDHVTDYIKFCEMNCQTKKTVKHHGNNKPWINKELKSLIISKRNAFKAKDQDRCKSIQKEINDKIKQCKYDYKDKIELKFKSMDSKGM